jgi:hypothetical protein
MDREERSILYLTAVAVSVSVSVNWTGMDRGCRSVPDALVKAGMDRIEPCSGESGETH